jgi:FMN phosphatase YigB (HAD superfamily)
VKQASYDWVLFDLDETLLDFPVARALERTYLIYGVAPTPKDGGVPCPQPAALAAVQLRGD